MNLFRWKRGLWAWLLAAMLGSAAAQGGGPEWNPRSGDPWVDTWLADINRYAGRYREPFIDELERYQGAPRALVIDLLVERRWAPADVYYACALAQAIDRPCRDVVDDWSAHRAEGWGAVASRLGVRPGSPAFQRLKHGVVTTYDRWSRPIVLDEDLSHAFPAHAGRAGAAKPDKAGAGKADRAPAAAEHGTPDTKGKRGEPRR